MSTEPTPDTAALSAAFIAGAQWRDNITVIHFHHGPEILDSETFAEMAACAAAEYLADPLVFLAEVIEAPPEVES